MTPEQLDEIERILPEIEDVAFREVPQIIKALREAREERDVLQAVLNDWQRFGMDREKERDAARAEVERLKALLEKKP